jgi:two-component system sensor histidine kinase KdpD
MLYEKLTGPATGFLDQRMIAHDMRAPLHALNLSVQAARRQAGNPQAVDTLLELAERNIRVLSSLVEGMLASDTSGGRELLVLRECEAQDIVMRAFDQVSAQASEKEQRLEARDMLALPPLVADADGLVRVLVNLLGNAIKFSPHGAHIQVSAKLRINDGHRVLVFSVTDDGVGVAPDQIDRIFLEGISVGVTGTSSTGLGLAVCRAIVEAHQGRIWVEPGRARGARFSFSVPTDLPPSARAASSPTALNRAPFKTPEVAGE